MTLRASLAYSFLLALGAIGCGGTVKTAPLPGDGYVITCTKGMKDCVARAEKECGDSGYTVAGGFNVGRLLGGPTSSYRKLAYSGELRIYCGIREVEPEACKPVSNVEEVHELSSTTVPTSNPEPIVSAPPRTNVEPPSARICVPGSTQKCVGPAACEGGQVCLPDGGGYGACDCGAGGPSSPPPIGVE